MLNKNRSKYENIVYAISAIENVISAIEDGISEIKNQKETIGLDDLSLVMNYSKLSQQRYVGIQTLKGIKNRLEFVIKNEVLYKDKDISVEDVVSFDDVATYKAKFNFLINKLERNATKYIELASNEKYIQKYKMLDRNKKEVAFFLDNKSEIIKTIQSIEEDYIGL
ncbi:MAG: hypothetical protein IJ086_11580 [Clostridium sp.]|nr:hypothetical protein [Clostridium sp.]